MENKKLQTVGKKGPDEDLRQWLENYIKRHPHLTPAVLERSDHIGGSRTMIDDYLAGKYFLPKESGGKGVQNSKVERLVRAYQEKVEGTVRHGYAGTFTETISWKRLVSAWDVAVEQNLIVACYGKPGVGKTRCLTELMVRRNTTMPVAVECSPNITVRYFAVLLAKAVGVAENRCIPELEDLVAEKLKKNPRPIIVDQANYLSPKSLGTICYIWNKARVPILLAGTQELFNLFHTASLKEDERGQLTSRVARHYPLPELSHAEMKAILKRGLGDAASDEVIAKVVTATGSSYRTLDFIIPLILELTKKNKEELKSGKLTMADITATAASRLIA
jgi:DNA transposition AAA+ family ATPase